jgi:hypothetical protein
MKGEDEIVVKRDANRSVSSLVTVGKDSVSLLRDLLLFLLALLLLAFPATFNSVLTSAGFEEGSFVGLKWKSKLLDSNAALNEARATITDLKAHLDETSKALADAQSKLNDPTLKGTIAKLEEQTKQLDASTAKVEASVANTLASNASYVQKAQNAVDTSAKWGVVYSGDVDLKGAQDETGRVAAQLGIPNAAIYLRDGSYRSVSVNNSRADADGILPRARQRRADAYVVNMSHWCANAVARDGFIECASP